MSRRIPYQEAIESLEAMFVGMDREVIHMILEENQGRIDPTVSVLLAMQSEDIQQQQKQQQAQPKIVEKKKQDFVVVHNLADDFLRPPSYFAAKHGNAGRIREQENHQQQNLNAAHQEIQIQVNQHGNSALSSSPKKENSNPNPNSNSAAKTFAQFGAAAKKKMEIFKEKLRRNKEKTALIDEEEDEEDGPEDASILLDANDSKFKKNEQYNFPKDLNEELERNSLFQSQKINIEKSEMEMVNKKKE
jgi:hypothetical protein